MASYSVNLIYIFGPWPSLARLSRFHAERGSELGPGSDPHLASWVSESALGLGLALRGSSRHAPPLASCLALSAEFPDCAFLMSHLDERAEREGQWALLAGEAIWSAQDCPDALEAARALLGGDPDLSQARAERLLNERAPALLDLAGGLEPLAEAFLTRELSDRRLAPLFEALAQERDPGQELAAALLEEPSFRGLTLQEARALLEAPPAQWGEPDGAATLWPAIRFASAAPIVTPCGPRPGGAFALFAEARGLLDSSEAGPRRLHFLWQIGDFLLSAAPVHERLELCGRYIKTPFGRRLLSDHSAARILVALTTLAAPTPGLSELADLLLDSRLLASQRLLELVLERLARSPDCGLPQQRALARVAEAMDAPERLALSQSPALARHGLLRSALELAQLGEGLREPSPSGRSGARL